MDALDLVYALAGVVVGAVGVAVLVEARSKGGAAPSPMAKLTTTWRIAELDQPMVVARDLEVELPPGARVLASGQVDAAAYANCEVRQVPHVATEFALDAKRSKALLFLGGVQPGATALVVVDPDLLARLDAEARSLWERSEPYVEKRSLAQLAGRSGLVVETQGNVQDVLPYQGSFLLRLEDDGHILGVQVEKEPSELRGARILVRGRLVKDRTGYPLLQASDVRRIQ